MTLTVTLNTALDLTYHLRKLRPYASHRITSATEHPAGKGLNVARVPATLGHEVTVTGFTGGPTGRTVQDQLATSGRKGGPETCEPHPITGVLLHSPWVKA